MSTPYSGNAAGGPNTSPAPGPNVAPVVNIPADTDPNNSATMFVEQYETLADFDAWTMQVLGGTRTAKKLIVDGTGGAVTSTIHTAEVRGDLNVTANVNAAEFNPTDNNVGSTVPTPSFNRYQLTRELIPVAWIIYSGLLPGMIQGTNISSAVRNSAGNYTFTLQQAAVVGSDPHTFAVATANGTGNIVCCDGETAAGVTTVNVFVTNTAGTFVDPSTVSVLVYGG